MEVPETERYKHILKPQRSKQPYWGQIKVWTRACHGRVGCSGPSSGHLGNREQDGESSRLTRLPHFRLPHHCLRHRHLTVRWGHGLRSHALHTCHQSVHTLSCCPSLHVCATCGRRYPAVLPLLSDMVNSSSPNPERTRCPKKWSRQVLAGPLLSSTLLAASALAIHPHLLGRADRHQGCFLRGQHLTYPRQARGVPVP